MKKWIITYSVRHHRCSEFVTFYTEITELTPLKWLRHNKNLNYAIIFAIETEEFSTTTERGIG